MKMKKILCSLSSHTHCISHLLLALIAIVPFSVDVRGQGHIKYCFNDGELIGEAWREADGVLMEDKVKRSPFYGFVFATEDEQLQKLLRDDAFYVEYNDTLYINCNRAIGEGTTYYARAERGKKADNVFFVSNVRSKQSVGLYVGAGIMGGIVGGAIVGATYHGVGSQSSAPYLWDMEQGLVTRLTPKTMKKLMAGNKNLLKKYKAEKKKRQATPGCVYEYLKSLGLL